MLAEKKQNILNLVSEYIKEKQSTKKWIPGQDWIEYSGPNYNEEEYVAAMSSLLDEWLVFGEKSREFEKTFSHLLGKKYGTLTNSGSSANLLMMAAARSKNLYNFKAGTKIITPIVCFPTTINPLIQFGLQPVFVDVELDSLNLDLDQVEKKLEEDPEIKGIIFAHVLGNPPNMDRLMFLIKKYNLVFFEDACDALGSYYDGKKLGSFGHMSTCSFYPAHHMTLGEGGFIATDDNKARKTLSSLRDWGRACFCNTFKPGSVTSGTACGNRFKNWLPGLPNTEYDHRYVYDEIGFNLKPIELQAAMGLEQIKKLPDMDSSRRENHKKLMKIFSKYEEYFHLPKATEKSDPCWFGFSLVVKDKSFFKRQQFVEYLEKNKIQTRAYFGGNILMHPAYSELVDDYQKLINDYPNANKITSNCFFLGTFIGLTDEKINYIENVVDEFFNKKVLRVIR